jgi:hypothetical protein
VEAASAGTTASGAGGKYPKALCDRISLYSPLHALMRTRASRTVQKISPFRNSSRSFPLNDSMYPFSQGDPGSMKSVVPPTAPSQSHTARREAYLDAHSETKPERAAAIRAGNLVVGMCFQDVETSLGTVPDLDVELGMGGPIDIRLKNERRTFVFDPNVWVITEILYPAINVPGIRSGTLIDQ